MESHTTGGGTHGKSHNRMTYTWKVTQQEEVHMESHTTGGRTHGKSHNRRTYTWKGTQ